MSEHPQIEAFEADIEELTVARDQYARMVLTREEERDALAERLAAAHALLKEIGAELFDPAEQWRRIPLSIGKCRLWQSRIAALLADAP